MESLFGVETEYALSVVCPDGAPLDRGRVVRQLLDAARQHLTHLPDRSGVGIFLQNGGRFYIDYGEHPEYCTPECTTPREAVRQIRAGDRIVERLGQFVERAGRAHRDASIEILISRCNVDYSGTGSTWGAHESFLCRRGIENLPAQIVPHLASRLIYTGAGGFNGRRPSALEFTLSPRVWYLDAAVSAESTRNRGIFHTKDEALATGASRLHLLCGESACSDRATFLKLGTTALVVALADGGVNPGLGVGLQDAVQAMRAFASDPSCRAVVRLVDGRSMTAIDIQRHYLELAEAHAADDFMPPFTSAVCAEWRTILEKLEIGPTAVATELDWAMKLALYSAHAEEHGVAWESLPGLGRAAALGRTAGLAAFTALRSRLFEIDVRFGQLGARGIFNGLDGEGVLSHRVPGVDRIEDAVTTPPPAGRARVRGERVRKLGGRRHNCLAGWTGIWDCESRKHIDLTDPFAETARWREWEASESIVTGMMGRMGEIWARRRRSPFWTMLEREMRGRLD